MYGTLWLQSSIEILGTLWLQMSIDILGTLWLLLISVLWSFSVIWFGHMVKIIRSSGFYLFGLPVSVYGPHSKENAYFKDIKTFFEITSK